MALIKCSNCGKEYDENWKVCPECGANLSDESSSESVDENISSSLEQLKKDDTVQSNNASTENINNTSEINLSENNPTSKRKTKKIVIGISAIIIIVIFLFSTKIICIHDWQNATCTNPQTCTKCDRTKGETLPHKLEEATCTIPQTCSVCGATVGEALGHDWVDATCTTPKTCSMCNETEGEILEHISGDWEVSENNYIKATQTKSTRCINCSTVIDTKSVSLDSLHNDEYFLFSIEDFEDRLNYVFESESVLSSHKALLVDTDETIGIQVKKNSDSILILFYDGNALVESASSREIKNIIISAGSDATDDVIYGLIGTVMACDPTLNTKEASDILSNLLSASMSSETYIKNGITYAAANTDDSVLFSFRID